jgi:predicted DNA-binding transcriptional regulator YafY
MTNPVAFPYNKIMKYIPKFERIFKIIEMFSNNKKVGMEEIIHEFGVSKRTIQRDFEYIRNKLKIEINYDKTLDKYFIEKQFDKIPFFPTLINEEEFFALKSALDFFKKSKNFPLIEDFEKFVNRIENFLKSFEYFSIFERTDYVIPANLKEIYKKIKKAIYDKRYIEFDYYGSREKGIIRRKVAPWFLTYAFGKWYLIGYCKIRDEMRTFNLKKIQNLEIKDEIFIETAYFDLKEFKKDMLGPWKGEKSFWVSIFYDKEVAKFIKEKNFFQEHKIEEFEDGSLRLKIKISSPEAVLFYLVLPYHFHAEIEKPKSLRKKVIKYMKKALEKYGI